MNSVGLGLITSRYEGVWPPGAKLQMVQLSATGAVVSLFCEPV
jgi:hypothetical protein